MTVPRLNIALPRPIEALHQIEITSECNLRCLYCPHRIMKRPKQHMDVDTFRWCLEAARRFVDAGTQHELNLAGLGESTLNPQFCEFVAMAREAMPDRLPIVMPTNGVGVTDEHMNAMSDASMAVWVSAHRPEKASPIVQALKKRGILAGISFDPTANPNDWAGQVEWECDEPDGIVIACHWLRSGRVMACSDGSITTCCLDAHGTGIVGTIHEINEIKIGPYNLCPNCYQEIQIVGYTQR